MPTPEQVNQQSQVQNAQQGVAPVDFDPAVILQEIAMKDMQNQQKEMELAEQEAQIQQMVQQIQQSQQQQAQTQQAQAQEQAQVQPAPVVPMTEGQQPMPPQSGPPSQEQQQGDLSPQTLQALQPGQKVTVTKKIQMTPQGPQEVGRSENISGSGA